MDEAFLSGGYYVGKNHHVQSKEEEYRQRAMNAVDDPGGMSLF